MPKFQKKTTNENPIADVWPDDVQPVNADGFTEAETAQNLPPAPEPFPEPVPVVAPELLPAAIPDAGTRFEAFKEALFKLCYRHGFVLVGDHTIPERVTTIDVKTDKSRLNRVRLVAAALHDLELAK